MGISQGDLYRRGKRGVIYWRRLEDGRQRNTSLGTANMRDAERLRAAHITDYHERHPDDMPGGGPNLDPEAFWRLYLPWAEAHKSAGTIRVEQSVWDAFLRFHRPARMHMVTRRDAEAFKTWFKHNGFAGAEVSDASVNKALRTLKSVFNAGRKLGYLRGENPFVGLRMFRIPFSEPEFLTDAEVDRLLAAAEAHSTEMNMLFSIALCAGLRRAELAHCRWSWFDFQHKVIAVQRGHGFELKDRANRSLPMHKRIADVLGAHAQPDGYVFPGNGGKRYRYDPRLAFAEVTEAAGVTRCTYQLMRSTFGSRLAQREIPIHKISRWMGHSSVEVTVQYYSGLQSYDETIDRI